MIKTTTGNQRPQSHMSARLAAATCLMLTFSWIHVRSEARAQSSPSRDVWRAAKRHKAAAKRLIRKEKNYKAAIIELKQSYDLVPQPILLYNIGEAYARLREDIEALAYFERYLNDDPTGRGAAHATDEVARLRGAVAARQAREGTQRHAQKYLDAAPQGARRDEARQALDAHHSNKQPDREQAPRGEMDSQSDSSWWDNTWMRVGTGIVMVGVGVVVDVVPEHNGQLDASDFVPLGLYGAGGALIYTGVF